MYGKFLSLENNAMSEFRNVEHKVIFEKLADAPLYNRINGAGYEQRDDDPVGRYLREVAERVQTLVAAAQSVLPRYCFPQERNRETHRFCQESNPSATEVAD